ncbi:MFS transporter [Sphaerotilus sp.]|uniref:MFS transporter n=1 Tax=Sphaerotilus sp. TaxID=2093942 RepID=UPI002ACD517B|nr:MFS transporter [Sphaerotilus sp.]MDZ7856418.1 MFS transporter [Sphaerotilus sp.]
MTAAVELRPDAARLSRARTAVRWQFGALGVLGGAWGAHIPSVKAQYALNETTLSLVLLSAALGAVSSLFFAGRLVERLGVRGVVRLGAVVMGVALALVLHWPGLWAVLPAMVLFGALMSCYDVSINAEGTALESLSGRTVMSNLHGTFSLGAMAGAALCAGLLWLEIAPAWQLAGLGLGVSVLAMFTSRGLLDGHPRDAGDDSEQAHFAWPRGMLLVIGLLIFAGMGAEGVMYDWCVLYLKQEVGMPQDLAALGYASFCGAMALARFAGDALRARYPERLLLGASASLSAVAMAVVLLSGHPVVSLIGYAFVGAGLAPVVPILFNAATRVPGVSRAAAIASVSSIGYSGFLVGPPLIGFIAHSATLTAAMWVVVAGTVLLGLGARRVPVQD